MSYVAFRVPSKGSLSLGFSLSLFHKYTHLHTHIHTHRSAQMQGAWSLGHLNFVQCA
jgi:hypothetical protein